MALAAVCILYFYINCSYFSCKIVIFKRRRCLFYSFPYAHSWSALLLNNNSCRIAVVHLAIYLVPIVWNLPCPLITVCLDLEEAMALNDCLDHSLVLFENETDAFKLCFQDAYLLNRKKKVILIGMTKVKVINKMWVCNRCIFCLDIRKTNVFAYHSS